MLSSSVEFDDEPASDGSRVIAITGASGFIGARLVEAMLAGNSDVSLVTIDLEDMPIDDQRLRHFVRDLRDPASLDDVPDADIVVHLAAVAKEPGYPHEEYFETNDIATQVVCDYAERSNAKELHFTSTMMVFSPADEPRLESNTCDPSTAYGMSKLLAEHRVTNCSVPSTIYRPAVVYGPGEQGNYRQLLHQISSGRFAYVGRPDTRKSAIHVDDLILLIDHCSRNEIRGTIHASSPTVPTIQEVVEALQDALGQSKRFPTVPLFVARSLGFAGEMASAVGVDNPLNRRRMEKLRFSTWIESERVLDPPFAYRFDLVADGIRQWKDEVPNDFGVSSSA